MELTPLPAGPFTTIIADPPWPYGDRLMSGGGPRRKTRGAANHYTVMSLNDIIALPVATSAAENAHLYLWATNAFVEEAHVVARAWGFTTKTLVTWVKPQIGMGRYFRNSTEHVLFGVRGSLPPLRRNCPTAFTAARRKHSQKPDEFYAIVESMSPGPYLELFARARREGWVSWGNELDVDTPEADRPGDEAPGAGQRPEA